MILFLAKNFFAGVAIAALYVSFNPVLSTPERRVIDETLSPTGLLNHHVVYSSVGKGGGWSIVSEGPSSMGAITGFATAYMNR
jgi:hypothetical protein